MPVSNLRLPQQVNADWTQREPARKLSVPIYQLLGGKLRDKLKVYAWIGGDRPGDVEAQAYKPQLQQHQECIPVD